MVTWIILVHLISPACSCAQTDRFGSIEILCSAQSSDSLHTSLNSLIAASRDLRRASSSRVDSATPQLFTTLPERSESCVLQNQSSPACPSVPKRHNPIKSIVLCITSYRTKGRGTLIKNRNQNAICVSEAEEQHVTYRPYVEDDIPFIQSSWGSSYYTGAGYQKFVSPEIFHLFHRPLREHYLSRPTAAVIVCVSKDDPSLIVGWIAVEKPKDGFNMILHYLYVKQDFRKAKIASELIAKAIPKGSRAILTTHVTDVASKILVRSKYRDYEFTPHLV